MRISWNIITKELIPGQHSCANTCTCVAGTICMRLKHTWAWDKKIFACTQCTQDCMRSPITEHKKRWRHSSIKTIPFRARAVKTSRWIAPGPFLLLLWAIKLASGQRRLDIKRGCVVNTWVETCLLTDAAWEPSLVLTLRLWLLKWDRWKENEGSGLRLIQRLWVA
jgi:hypothetical protein